ERPGDVRELVRYPARDDQHITFAERVLVLAGHHGGPAADDMHDVGLPVVQLHRPGPGAAAGVELVAGRLQQQTAGSELLVDLLPRDVRRRIVPRWRFRAEYREFLTLVRGRGATDAYRADHLAVVEERHAALQRHGPGKVQCRRASAGRLILEVLARPPV